MVGVCGIGMAGVAYLLRKRGFRVSGCDATLNRQAAWLTSAGVSVTAPHAAAHVRDSVDWVVRTPAVKMECEEIQATLSQGIPLFRRGEVLPALLDGFDSVAVAGTHGKTTTSTLITQLLKGSGRDPWWCIGGESATLGAVAGSGRDSIIVVEADESDGTLVNYHPDVAVITNVEFDHMEHFASEQEFEACFERFVAQTRRCVLYCVDDARAVRLCADSPKARSYGFSEAAALRGVLHEQCGQTVLTVSSEGAELGAVKLPIPGDHNALNALGAIGVCLELGIPFDTIASAMNRVSLPKRRFEMSTRADGVKIVSDYAHHPSEIAALVQTAKQQHAGRVLALFQPHRYTRTRALGPAFPAAFVGVNLLVLAPVYAASELPLDGGRSCDLYAQFRDRDTASGSTPLSSLQFERPTPNAQRPTPNGEEFQLMLATSLEQAWGYLRRELREGDMLLVVGAGDVEQVAAWAGGEEEFGVRSSEFGSQTSEISRTPSEISGVSVEQGVTPRRHSSSSHLVDYERRLGVSTKIEPDSPEGNVWGSETGLAFPDMLSEASVIRECEPLCCKTMYGVGGSADVWVELGGVDDLAKLLHWCHVEQQPFRLLGAGSNLLVSDMGVRGVVGRLTGEGFRGVRLEEGEVIAGGAVSLARLLDWVTQASLTGLEFLEGIPSGIGGIVRMNGGAYGHTICERLSWIRGLKHDGSECTVQASALEWGYRGCKSIESMVVVEVGLHLDPGDQSNIVAERKRIAERRRWMRGLRCSGSVFRNPDGQVAGQLIEALGLKGSRIGGARVLLEHGNFIVADKNATASDVLALIQRVQAAVKSGHGIELVPEVLFWE